MKILNYILSFIILGFIIVLIFNNFKQNNVRKSNISELEKKDSLINKQANLIIQFKEEAQKVDTTIYFEYGNLQKVYKSEQKRYEKLISILKSQKLDTIKVQDLKLNTKVDSLENDDLFLKYKITTFGYVLKTNFDYKIKQKEIIKTKIIYEPEYINVPKPFYEPKRNMYASVAYGLTQTHFSVDLMYYTKKRFGFGVGFNFAKFDVDYKWYSFKVAYKVF